jgi:hypothetical protein
MTKIINTHKTLWKQWIEIIFHKTISKNQVSLTIYLEANSNRIEKYFWQGGQVSF